MLPRSGRNILTRYYAQANGIDLTTATTAYLRWMLRLHWEWKLVKSRKRKSRPAV